MALDNIHLEAFRDDGPDYPVQQGLTFPYWRWVGWRLSIC
jgi:hypothetical protein